MAMDQKLTDLMNGINAAPPLALYGMTAEAAGESISVCNKGVPIGTWHLMAEWFEYRSPSTDYPAQRAHWLEQAIAVTLLIVRQHDRK